MRITKDILDAVSRAAERYGNVSELAKVMGVAHSTIIFWRTGKTTHMSAKLWNEKVRSVLLPFMPGGLSVGESCGVYRVGGSTASDRSVPVVSLKSLLDFDPAIESIFHCVRSGSAERHMFSVPGLFCFSTTEISCSAFPPGAFVLVKKNPPENGDTILAKLHEEGEVILGKYLRDGDKIELEILFRSESKKQKKIVWNCRSRQGVLLWAFPLVELSMSLSAVEKVHEAEEEAE